MRYKCSDSVNSYCGIQRSVELVKGSKSRKSPPYTSFHILIASEYVDVQEKILTGQLQ